MDDSLICKRKQNFQKEPGRPEKLDKEHDEEVQRSEGKGKIAKDRSSSAWPPTRIG
jgi:hypothetical protein